MLTWISRWVKVTYKTVTNKSIQKNYFPVFTLVRQKHPSKGVLRKRCSENMQQIFRRAPMPRWDFNKVAKQLYWNRTSAWVFSCKFAAYFQNIFSQEHLWRAASGKSSKISVSKISVSKTVCGIFLIFGRHVLLIIMF